MKTIDKIIRFLFPELYSVIRNEDDDAVPRSRRMELIDNSLKKQLSINEQMDKAIKEIYSTDVDNKNVDMDGRFSDDFVGLFYSQKYVLNAIFDGNVSFLTGNPAWKHYLGWDASDLIGMRYSDIIHPNDVDRSFASELDRHINGPTSNEFVLFKNRYLCKDRDVDGDKVYRWLMWYPGLTEAAEGDTFVTSCQAISPNGNIVVSSLEGMLARRKTIKVKLSEIADKKEPIQMSPYGTSELVFHYGDGNPLFFMRTISGKVNITIDEFVDNAEPVDLLQESESSVVVLDNILADIDGKPHKVPYII